MTEQTSAGQNVVEIRKYPNRRYYDTSRSTHVTLEEIHAMIRAGKEIRVIDSKTNEDITAKVLTQIILDLDSPKLGIFPVPLLHRLIRSNEQIVTDFVEKYFNKALSAFLDSQRSFEQYLRHAMGLQGPPAGLPDWTKFMWGALAPWGAQAGESQQEDQPSDEARPSAPAPEAASQSPAGGASPAPAAPQTDHSPQPESDLRSFVESLRSEVAELRRQQQRPGAASRRSKPASKRPRK